MQSNPKSGVLRGTKENGLGTISGKTSEQRLKQIVKAGDHLKLQTKSPFSKSVGPTIYDLGGGVRTTMNIKKISDNHFVFNEESESQTCTGEGSPMMMGIEGSMQKPPHAENTQVLAPGGPEPREPGAVKTAQVSKPMQTCCT